MFKCNFKIVRNMKNIPNLKCDSINNFQVYLFRVYSNVVLNMNKIDV